MDPARTGYARPVTVADSRRRRPPPLIIDSLALTRDDTWPPRNEDIPVRRTFIDFGSLTCLTGTPPDSPLRSVSTAPARLGCSMRGAFDYWKAAATSSASTSSTRCTIAVTPTGSSDSSARVSASSLLLELELSSAELPHTGVKAGLLPTLTKDARSQQASLSPVLRSPSLQEGPRQFYPNAFLQTDSWRERPLMLPQLSSHSQVPTDLIRRPIKLAEQLGDVNVDDGESTDDGASSDDNQRLCPVYSENAPLPSLGSAPHGEGKCKRCCFFPKGRCTNGTDCPFCHFAHDRRTNTKTKKKKNRRRKQRLIANQNLAISSAPPPPQPTSVHQILGSSMCLPQTPQKSSKLIVHDLQFVPSTTMPGQSSTAVLQMWQRC